MFSSGGQLAGGLEEYGVQHIKADIRTKAEFSPRVWRALPGMIRVVKDGDFDLVHAQTRVTQVMAEVVKMAAGTPYVTTCHGRFKHTRLSRRLLPCWGDRTIAISESVREHLVTELKVPREKVELVYNGIDLERCVNISPGSRAETLKKTGIPVDAAVIGSVGRFSSVKGFRYLVEAFASLAKERQDLYLLMVGSGPEEKDLAERAESYGVRSRVFFVDGPEPLQEYLAAMDIFCMPSLSEGFGLAVVEAMAAGKPCLVSDVGGLTEIVTDGREGLVVPPGSVPALTDAIRRVISSGDLAEKLSLAARERAREFSLQKTVSRTMEVYERALACWRRGGGVRGKNER